MTMMKNHDESVELARAEAWLDHLEHDDPDVVVDHPIDLHRIGLAANAIDAAREELAAAVAAAREDGRSWGAIGLVLGVSKQAARERFGVPHQRTPTHTAANERTGR